ncbi:ATP-binding protein involved in chromosome partitioning [Halorubrum alkaliphilum]|uniref:Iron-sulfur cluster carrier protein n=1 Tax=Halorubrum alkaliphilum TaxID=261290 RepID=A0A8T4GHM5_9EURY|nr:P-loop NTPase [Halorubrum alkaliphilum]MBP1923217.1 ATP-binding protein involved in chromosome partitioning [Halorubrum alkaliphilum]
MTVDADRVRERLRAVEDPVLGSDIADLGLIDDVRIEDGVATVAVAFNAPYSGDEKAMGDRIREEVEALGLDPEITVSLSWEDSDSPLPDVRNVVPIASGKGGVGKTTVATNLATALAEAGARVGLLDADVYGPNVPGMIGIEARPGLTEDGRIVPPEADGMKLMSMAFLSEDDTDPALLRGPMIDKLLSELIEETEWGELDYLLVDLPPGTGDEQLTLLQNVPVTGAVVVTTPEDIALEDVRKGIRMFLDRGTPVLGIVENMSSFRCPSCGDEHELYGSGGGAAIAEEYDVPLLAEVPMDPDIRSGGDADEPVTALRATDAADRFFDLRDAVVDRIGAVNRAEKGRLDPDDPDSPLVPPADPAHGEGMPDGGRNAPGSGSDGAGGGGGGGTGGGGAGGH